MVDFSVASQLRNRPRRPQQQREQQAAHAGIGSAFDASAGQREPKSVMVQMASLRFLYCKVLRRSYSRDDIPLPRTPRRQIPIVLSTDEVRRLIDCGYRKFRRCQNAGSGGRLRIED